MISLDGRKEYVDVDTDDETPVLIGQTTCDETSPPHHHDHHPRRLVLDHIVSSFEISARRNHHSLLIYTQSAGIFNNVLSWRHTIRRFQCTKKVVAACWIAVIILAMTVFIIERNRNSLKAPDNVMDQSDRLNEPNPPILPHSMVLIYPPRNDEEIQQLKKTLQKYSDPILTREDFFNGDINRTKSEDDAIEYPTFTHTSDNHYSTSRTALLFTPGVYSNIDFEVGYYTSVLGVGKHPDDVLFTDCDFGPHVPALDKYTNRPPNGSGLNTFWRSIENIASEPRRGMLWTDSQAAPLRRIHVRTDLNLFDNDSWVSGGVAANMIVEGTVNFGGQQQWLMRNVEVKGGTNNGAWSLVFAGCTGAIPSESNGMMGPGPSISVDHPNVRVEKPYISMKTVDHSLPQMDKDQQSMINYKFELRVPSVTVGNDAIGPLFDDTHDIRDFQRVKLAIPSSLADIEDAAVENHIAIQKALDDGKDVVLSPGIYPLSRTLTVKYENQVVLGLGYATLLAPNDGSPCIRVESRVPGVRIAGIMLEASVLKKNGEGNVSSLLEWGRPNTIDPGDDRNPGVLSDIFVRVGGLLRMVSTDVMIRLFSGNIYGDNLWLWRADHVKLRLNEEPNFPHISSKFRQTVAGECEVKNGLIVYQSATNITIVGLAVEHTTEDQVIWNADNGQVYFYQSELPYDANNTFSASRFVGYRVGSHVVNHRASGLGVYSNFRDNDVAVWTGVVHPIKDIHMKNIFTVKLDNIGKIRSVVNGLGPGPEIDTERGIPRRCSDETCTM